MTAIPPVYRPLNSYSLDPIVVGPRNLVGTENFAAKQAKGIAKGVLGSLLGGGGSNKSSKPKTKKGSES